MASPSDVFDAATDKEMADRETAISAIRSKAGPEFHEDFESPFCLDCDGEIPEARLALGKIRCVGCQTAVEKQNKLKGI